VFNILTIFGLEQMYTQVLSAICYSQAADGHLEAGVGGR